MKMKDNSNRLQSSSASDTVHQPLSAMDRRFLCSLKCFLVLFNVFTLLIFFNVYSATQYLDSFAQIASGFRNETKRLIKLQNELSSQQHIVRLGTRHKAENKMNTMKKSVTRRPRFCKGCFEHNYEYLIDNVDICQNGGKTTDVVLMIFSTHSRREQRQALRKTWLTYAKNNKSNIRYAFLFGNIKNATENRLLRQESELYGDIIQESFVDSYQNLTIKTIMAFKWASTHCPNARFMMKADDDVYVNIPGVLRKIRNHGDILQTRIGGVCKRNTKPDRNPNSKWFLSYEMYPGKTIPEFCSGTAYITSLYVAKNIYKISRDIPYVNLEDVYISLCVRELGYKFVDIFGFNAMRNPYKYCVFKKPRYVTAHSYSPKEMMDIWKAKC